MKKFILCLFLGMFFVMSNLDAQTKSHNTGFGTARLDSLKKIEKTLKIDIDSCLVQISRNYENDDIVRRLKTSQANLERTQRQMQYIRQIKGTKQTKKN